MRRLPVQAAAVRCTRRACSTWLTVLAATLLTLPPAADAEARPYLVRNQNPFLQVFGLPAPEGGTLTVPGSLESRVVFSLANHADEAETATEAIVLDGESYYVDTMFRYGLNERWEVGLDLPYVTHRNGKLDNLIEGWHDAFGLDNSERQRPSNHLQLTYRRGDDLTDIRHGGGGIGDVRLTAAYGFLQSDDGGRSMAMRGTVKLPTGDADHLRGSGATDLALSLEATDRTTFASRSLELSGQAGALLLGDGDVLADQQKSLVPFASMGLTWHWTHDVDLRAQLALQGEYFDSRLDEIGTNTASIAIGGVLRLRRLGVELDLALVEDLVSDTTPDFGLYFAVRRAPSTDPRP